MIVGPYAHYSLVVAFLFGGMQLAGNEQYGWASLPLILTSVVLGLAPLGYLCVTRLAWVRVFWRPNEGRNFVEELLGRLCLHGGNILSTYL